MAEQKFDSDPEGAQQLVAEARAGVAEALRELRDLARGIYPPVLADRGIGAALETLADRSPLTTTVAVDLDERPPAPVETAAYFVAAEALANATKHSGAEPHRHLGRTPRRDARGRGQRRRHGRRRRSRAAASPACAGASRRWTAR